MLRLYFEWGASVSIAIVACWIAVWIEMVMSMQATYYRVGVFDVFGLAASS